MSSGRSCGTLSSAARTIVAARSSGRTSFREPLKARPIGERAVETTTASGTAPPVGRAGVDPPILPAGNRAAHGQLTRHLVRCLSRQRGRQRDAGRVEGRVRGGVCFVV